MSLKAAVLRLIEKHGYVVLKAADHRRLMGASPMSSRQPSEPRASQTPATPDEPLAAACRALAGKRIAGDVVVCGDGDPTSLASIGAALAALGDTTRRLTLIDVSLDPSHRAEAELDLWGNVPDLLAPRSPKSSPKPLPLPAELAALRYPAENIAVLHYPTAAIEIRGPIAFLVLSPENYPANRAWIRRLLPLVAEGGAIAVAGPAASRGRTDAVAEALRELDIALSFHAVSRGVRIGSNRGLGATGNG